MAFLKLPNGERVSLRAEHLLGRSVNCDSILEDREVSSRHALISWSDGQWFIRDLGSTNGTKVNERLIPVQDFVALHQGDTATLGGHSMVITDSSPPLPVAINLDTGLVHTGGVSWIALKEPDEAVASISLEGGVRWVLERPEGTQVLVDRQVFDCAGHTYRFLAPGLVRGTDELGTNEMRLADLELQFRVTRDEEYVEVGGKWRNTSLAFGAHAHHYTLLTLARRRKADQEEGYLSDSSHGWVNGDSLLSDLASSSNRLSVEIFRIRRQFSEAGFLDAADIIERRRGTGQLRFGLSQIDIITI